MVPRNVVTSAHWRLATAMYIANKIAAGALMVTPKESSFAAPSVTDVINTVGAGDAFTASMIMGFLNNKPLDQINQEANKLAAYVCTQHGAVPALPESLTA